MEILSVLGVLLVCVSGVLFVNFFDLGVEAAADLWEGQIRVDLKFVKQGLLCAGPGCG